MHSYHLIFSSQHRPSLSGREIENVRQHPGWIKDENVCSLLVLPIERLPQCNRNPLDEIPPNRESTTSIRFRRSRHLLHLICLALYPNNNNGYQPHEMLLRNHRFDRNLFDVVPK